jgi:hypothetical protein
MRFAKTLTPRRRQPPIAALLLAALAPLASLDAEEVRAPESPPWEESRRLPDWVESPPLREGWLRFVSGGMSNLRDLAHSAVSSGRSNDVALGECRRECARRLRALLGRDADRVAQAATAPVLLRRASRGETWKPGTLGGSAVTVFGLWEAPLAPLLDAVPEGRRAEARAALEEVEGAGVPWETTRGAPPAWVASPVVRAGHAHVLVADRAQAADLARAQASILGPNRLFSRFVAAIEPDVGRAAAFEAARAAGTWRVLKARTVRAEGNEAIAWIAWDVPVAPILERLPEQRREAARRALERVLRSD